MTAMLLFAVVGLAIVTRRDLGRLDRLGAYAGHIASLQRLSLELQQLLATDTAGSLGSEAASREIAAEIDRLRRSRMHLDPATGEHLGLLLELVESGEATARGGLIRALGLSAEILDDETRAHARLLAQVRSDTRAELLLAIGVFLAIPALVLAGFTGVRRRILRPLDGLAGLFTALSEGRFEAVETAGTTPLLAPLFTNYNRLVARLAELEAEHRTRARRLEDEVERASRALFEQQRTLARAERLAAVGETAASLAHELRNPLAGIVMALANLDRDLADEETRARLRLIRGELDRLTRLLNDHLAAVRHRPEESAAVDLSELSRELLALMRYQVPRRIDLDLDAPEPVVCRVPRDRVRQALLNLVLNSVHAIGPDAGRIVVAVRRDGARISLSVCDDGPGFPEALVRGGARPFAALREGGTGLGLAIVRRTVAELGGELRLANVDPHGALVTIALACADA